MVSSTAWPALTMIITLRGDARREASSALEWAPRIFLPAPLPARKSSTLLVVLL